LTLPLAGRREYHPATEAVRLPSAAVCRKAIMRIMEIVSGVHVNGAVHHCVLLSRELIRRGHKLTLLCRPGAWIAEELADAPIDVIFSDLRRFPPYELRRVAAEIRGRGIDVIHTHMSRAHSFGVLLRWMAGVPSVATAHTRLVQPHWMFNDLVIAVSDATRRFQCRYNLVRPSRITTIHSFIDPRPLTCVPADARARFRQSLGVGPQTPLFGTLGTILPRKGQLYLVRALPGILAAVPEARLVIIGETHDEHPQYRAKLEQTAQRLGVSSRIVWAGYCPNAYEILAALDVFALASLEENLPMAILEAMALGLPPVATAVGGIPECVVSGETGLLVPPANPKAMAAAVASLLADPAQRRRLGEAGRRQVHESFSLEGQITRIEAALQTIVSRRAA
jgi:glycosyltransferase involved in cell wall biosynthesis